MKLSKLAQQIVGGAEFLLGVLCISSVIGNWTSKEYFAVSVGGFMTFVGLIIAARASLEDD